MPRVSCTGGKMAATWPPFNRHATTRAAEAPAGGNNSVTDAGRQLPRPGTARSLASSTPAGCDGELMTDEQPIQLPLTQEQQELIHRLTGEHANVLELALDQGDGVSGTARGITFNWRSR